MLIETKIISKARGEGAPLPAAKIESFLSEHSDLSESELIVSLSVRFLDLQY